MSKSFFEPDKSVFAQCRYSCVDLRLRKAFKNHHRPTIVDAMFSARALIGLYQNNTMNIIDEALN